VLCLTVLYFFSVNYEKMLEIYQKNEKEIKEKEKQEDEDLVK
jgi:hypothetical protein